MPAASANIAGDRHVRHRATTQRIDNLLYMSSSSDASGVAIITLYFLPGTNPDTAQVQVQNKLQLRRAESAADCATARRRRRESHAHFMMFFTLLDG